MVHVYSKNGILSIIFSNYIIYTTVNKPLGSTSHPSLKQHTRSFSFSCYILKSRFKCMINRIRLFSSKDISITTTFHNNKCLIFRKKLLWWWIKLSWYSHQRSVRCTIQFRTVGKTFNVIRISSSSSFRRIFAMKSYL